MPSETPLQRLASLLLEEPVMPWIQRRRDDGMPWRGIASELKDATDGEIDVPYQTLIYWAEERAGKAAS